MTFDEWLEEQPFKGVLFQGTINMMRRAWEASREHFVTPVSLDRVVLDDDKTEYRMRGDIRD